MRAALRTVAQSTACPREHVSASERDALGMQANFLPLKGRLVRMLVYGGGGCGKTLLVNQVIKQATDHVAASDKLLQQGCAADQRQDRPRDMQAAWWHKPHDTTLAREV